MSAHVGAARRLSVRSVRMPHLALTVLVPAGLAHVLALVGLVTAWSQYRSPWAAAALLVASATLPAVLAVAAVRRAVPGGALPTAVTAVVAAGVPAVSLGLLADLPPALWVSWGSWGWGAGAMTLLGLAAHIPPRRTAALAGGYGALAAGAVLVGGGGLWNANLALVAAAVPPLAAAHYLHLYADALRRRGAATRPAAQPGPCPVAQLPAPGREDLDVVPAADVRRLAILRDGIEPLLRDVADGAPLPLDNARSAAARRLAGQLREALAAQRRTLWLPETAGDAPVRVVATDSVARATGDDDRAWLAALIDQLGGHPDWEHVQVVLDRRLDGSVTAVLTARGAAARAAAADPRVRALCDGRSARCDADDGLLVVEAEILTKIGA